MNLMTYKMVNKNGLTKVGLFTILYNMNNIEASRNFGKLREYLKNELYVSYNIDRMYTEPVKLSDYGRHISSAGR